MLISRPTPKKCAPTSKITVPTSIIGRPTSKSRRPTPSESFPTLHLSRPTCVGRSFCSVGAMEIVVFLSFCYFCPSFLAKKKRDNKCAASFCLITMLNTIPLIRCCHQVYSCYSFYSCKYCGSLSIVLRFSKTHSDHSF